MARDSHDLHPAEIAKLEAETALANAVLAKRNLEIDEMRVEHEMRKASEYENRIFVFDGTVNASNVQTCIRTLGSWVRREPGKPIEITFNSPGGSVFDGLALYDFIQQLRDHGTRLDTRSLGMAASMGGVLLQAGEHRSMSKHSYLLIHEVSSVSHGKTSEMEDELKFSTRLQDRLLTILAERSTLSKRQIKNKWKRKDWWLDAVEAHDLGFCDEVK